MYWLIWEMMIGLVNQLSHIVSVHTNLSFTHKKIIMQNMFSAERMVLFGKEVFQICLRKMERNSAMF